ncbi:MAG: peptide MFS transporter [Sphingobacteriales bacterium]|jgi:POT family proton-dependent oligopeptide transporter|nr:peptide MFS transporter [Sphingobacteriales bacterium]
MSKHPAGLPYLFLSEMWERFGYYLMIGIFTLYLKDVETGFAMTEKEASDLYGTFIALVFLTPFLGGLIADRYLGYTKSVVIGGVLMGTGYCLMGIHDINVLYAAMTLVMLGNGFFKPNISTLLGNLYSTDQYRARKDEGYNIFYMGINVGAFVCNFFGAALQILFGWTWAFFAAGVGMFIGLIVFLMGKRHYQGFDQKKGVQPGDMPMTRIVGLILLPAVLFGVLGWMIPGDLFGSDSTDAFILSCIPVVLFYASLWGSAPKAEKAPIAAMLAIFAVVILFWAVFKQNGSALNTWADRYTDRRVEGNTAVLFDTFKQSKEITYSKDSVPLYDEYFRLKKENGEAIKEVNYPVYFRNEHPDRIPSEGTSISVWATNLSQSINPGWVILLTPLVVAFFTWLRGKGKEPSTPAKIAYGLFISALSALVMVAAAKAGSNGAEKVTVWWLIACYGVITIGELFLSPMGLSLVSKLSPPRITSLMMGGWFLSTSIGNKLSGVLASMWDNYEQKADFFLFNCSLLLAATALAFVLLRWLNKVFNAHT